MMINIKHLKAVTHCSLSKCFIIIYVILTVSLKRVIVNATLFLKSKHALTTVNTIYKNNKILKFL